MSSDILYSSLPPSTKDILEVPETNQDDYNIFNFLKDVVEESNKNRIDEIEKHPCLMVNSKRMQTIRKKKSALSLKERRELGLYKLRRSNMKYEDFLPLHNLWKEYFSDYIDFDTLEKQGFKGSPNDRRCENVSRMLLKADYHGAMLKVKKSLNSHLIGKEGIVVFDTKNTFQLLGKDDALRVIPKEACVFTFSVHNFTFTILGNQFCIKPSQRNSKKVKCIINLDL